MKKLQWLILFNIVILSTCFTFYVFAESYTYFISINLPFIFTYVSLTAIFLCCFWSSVYFLYQIAEEVSYKIKSFYFFITTFTEVYEVEIAFVKTVYRAFERIMNRYEK